MLWLTNKKSYFSNMLLSGGLVINLVYIAINIFVIFKLYANLKMNYSYALAKVLRRLTG